MEPKVLPLRSLRTKLFQKLIIFLLFFLLIATAGATENIVKPNPSQQDGVSLKGENAPVILQVTEMSYWEFLLWLGPVVALMVIYSLCSKKLVFTIAGYKIINPINVLDNQSRYKVYAYIKTKPGAYISEIVEQIGLDREIVKYHIKTLKAKNKIDAYKDGGKVRYFENVFVYNEDERKVISALQNLTNQRIISEIINGKCDTNSALAREFGLSRATISWYMKNLIETGLIIETKEGRKTSYKINEVYIRLIEKYTQQLPIPQ